jgi:hypothetical protein
MGPSVEIAGSRIRKNALYFAFNYSNDGGDGGIRVKGIKF